jgi:hypothetical protein
MPRYVIERQYLVPMFEHILIEASTFDEACREAVDDLIQPWGEDAQLCFDDARATTVICAVELPEEFEPQLQKGKGDDGHNLSSLLYCSELEQLKIPDEFARADELLGGAVGFV